MKKGLTEIIFIVDRSGSMSSIRADIIGGFNSFLKNQKKVSSECKVSFFQFDTGDPTVEKIYETMDIKEAPELTENTFVPRGGTPLYDAIAHVVHKTGDRFSSMDESERPEKVLVVIITDGEENSSHEWNNRQIKQMIEHQTEKYSWEFVYLGANQDAWEVGSSIGVRFSSSLGYVASKGGVGKLFSSLSDKTTQYRSVQTSAGSSINFDEEDKKSQEDEGLKV
jgi:Mg-chelatase subunit ChlD